MQLYNTLTRQKEDFVPLRPPAVKMYVCGPTVYNYLHVGNFRGPVVCNLLRNWLEHRGFQVHFVLNFTDVDDKIIKASVEQQVPPEQISEKYIFEYKKDFAALGLRAHEANPTVTGSMPEIISFIATLIEREHAYVTPNGDVYYAVRSFPGYGQLSGRKVDDLRSGARVEVGEIKRDPLDFALWKTAKPGEPAWSSPWGQGRPGWHIECSAMACKHLGEQIDIHGGGTDLMFPHHENEIAQSEGALNERFSKYWFHWNMINFDGQKMSKSLGNFTTMRDFLQKHHPEIYKWMILSVHYRNTADFNPEVMDRAVTVLGRIYSALATAESLLPHEGEGVKADPAFEKIAQETWARVEKSLDDDLNTPEAFAAMFDFLRQFNAQVKRGVKVSEAAQGKALVFRDLIRRLGSMMSLFQQPAASFLRDLDDLLLAAKSLDRAEIDKLVEQRAAARLAKDFKTSDEVRDKLAGMGIAVSDTPNGSHWEVAK
ncbi:MAG: cysteine--tRNA ligase [Bdellovibrionaceae bacterium]|nr:cysteine--tRNA ligase [Pseudobdellovibrionaceae bacterium]